MKSAIKQIDKYGFALAYSKFYGITYFITRKDDGSFHFEYYNNLFGTFMESSVLNNAHPDVVKQFKLQFS